jgi:hypothetical protein
VRKVLSNNDGCVIARSNEAKALGIAMGEAWHICRRRVDTGGVIVRSSNYTLYGDMSARVMRALSRFTPDLEIYSIDEAFLGLAGFETRLAEHARDLRRTVLRWTGIPVSVGIADPACAGGTEGSEWLHEIKFEGYRMHARLDRGAAGAPYGKGGDRRGHSEGDLVQLEAGEWVAVTRVVEGRHFGDTIRLDWKANPARGQCEE